MKHKTLSNNKKRKIKTTLNSAKNALSISDFNETENLCQAVLKLDDCNAEAYYLLGLTAHKIHQDEAAIELLKKACHIKPNQPDFWNDLGIIYAQQKNFQHALHCYNQSLDINPKQADVHANKAYILEQSDHTYDAIQTMQAAITLQPNNAIFYYSLGSLLHRLHHLEEAQEAFLQVIKLIPTHTEALYKLASIDYQKGKFTQSAIYLKKILTLDPDMALAYYLLELMRKLPQNMVKKMKELYSDTYIDNDSRAKLGLVLAKISEREKEYQNAFTYLQEANQLIRTGIEYDVSHDKITYNEIKKVFSPQFIQEKSQFGISDTGPVFVIGMPRSGSSLTEQILASHPDAFGTGEIGTIINIFRSLCKNTDNIQALQHLKDLDSAAWPAYAQAYSEHIRELAGNKNIKCYIDKTLPNFFLVGLIHILFPNARIIHCTRNTMDNCLSIFKESFDGDLFKFAYNLDELGEFFLLYKDLMQHWKNVLPAGVMYELKYEKLLEDQQGETAKLLQHCRLDWHDDCLQFHKTKRDVKTASATQVRQPIYKTSVEGWRRYEEELTPLAKKLGCA